MLAVEMLGNLKEGNDMICPNCRSESEMAYSELSYSFICLEPACSFEVEMDPDEAQLVLAPEDELVCC